MRLFLCEKPSQGKDIGRILGATQRGEGCLNGSGVTVTWCIGHLVEAAAPEAYDEQLKRWSIEQLPIIPQHWRVEVKPKTATQFKGRQSAPGEGDPACHRHRCRPRGRVDRPRDRGALRLPRPHRTPVAVGAQRCVHSGGTGQLRPSAETLSMYHSALARSRADWLVGMNLSRLFTVLGRQAGYDGVLSVGRVQTPTLKLVVDRDREIARFVSVPYWAIAVSLFAGGSTFAAQWVPPDACTDDAGRCLRQPVAQQTMQQIRAAGSAHVVSVETERVREGPPLPFDLGTLQEVCSKQLGLDVQETLRLPKPCTRRTRPRRTPLGLRLPAREHVCRSAHRSRQPAQDRSLAALDHGPARPLAALARLERWQGHGAPRHHPDARTGEALRHEREGTGRVQAHPVALPGAVPPSPRVRPHCGQVFVRGQNLAATGKQVVIPGWRQVLAEPQAEDGDGEGDTAVRAQVLPALPKLYEGLACQVADVDLKALKTLPPKPYTQGELVKSMKGVAKLVSDPRLKQKLKDTVGIGTEATRANIIGGLIARGYLVKKGRAIRASDAAFTLIDAVPAAIADPGTTAVWEQALDMIEAGQLTLDVFIGKQAAWISQLIAQYGSASRPSKVPQGRHARSAAHPRASAAARAARSGRAAATRTAKARCQSNPAAPSAAPRARAVAAAKAPDRPVPRVSRARLRRRGPCPHPHACPAGRPARNAFLIRVRPAQPSPAAGPEGSFSASRTTRVLLICVSSALCEGSPGGLPGCTSHRETPSWSAVIGAGARRCKNGSLCARMCARRCRPQPRHGPGVIA